MFWCNLSQFRFYGAWDNRIWEAFWRKRDIHIPYFCKLYRSTWPCKHIKGIMQVSGSGTQASSAVGNPLGWDRLMLWWLLSEQGKFPGPARGDKYSSFLLEPGTTWEPFKQSLCNLSFQLKSPKVFGADFLKVVLMGRFPPSSIPNICNPRQNTARETNHLSWPETLPVLALKVPHLKEIQ